MKVEYFCFENSCREKRYSTTLNNKFSNWDVGERFAVRAFIGK
jgi:hypothetical protein